MRKRTKARSFGNGPRLSHDSSHFYHSNLYASETDEPDSAAAAADTPFPAELENRILAGSSERMSAIPDNSVHLMVTSPPYNTAKDYDENLSLEAYLSLLRSVFSESHRVLVEGGRACINIANLGRRPYLALSDLVSRLMQEIGFKMRGEIIWNKGMQAGISMAWGSWRSASNPVLRDTHEYIQVYSKGTFRRKKPAGCQSTITRDEFMEWTKSVWTFRTESARKVGHPAPFPVELPHRLIQLYTFSGDVVLDPFMGSGSTALAALQSGRKYIGYEIDPAYVRLAEERIAAAPSQG